jgi:hypothetical protein
MTAYSGTNSSAPKLREAVHYICKKYALQTEKLGAVKLQKVIWFFDVKCFIFHQQTATGAVFVKGLHGPFTRDIDPIILELVAADRLFTDTEDFHDNVKARFVGKGQTDLSVFTEKERRWLDEISTEICESHTAASISERTHGPLWEMARFGEPIPFAAAALRLRKPTPEAVEAIKGELA